MSHRNQLDVARLRKWREHQGYSVAQAAKHFYLPMSMISAIEAGQLSLPAAVELAIMDIEEVRDE